MNVLIKAHLEPVVRRQRRVRLARRLAAGWAGAALVGLGLIILQRQGGWTSSLALPLTALLGVIATIVVVVHHRRHGPDWRRIAHELETKFPELEGRLLTAVQQPAKDGEALNYLQERIVREAALHNLRAGWMTFIPGFHVALARAAQVLALTLFAVVLWKLRVVGGHTWLARNAEPGVTVTPGDVSLERGNSLVVLARFGGSLPVKVDLVVGAAPETSRSIPLVKSLADPVFGGSVPEVASNLLYHVEYAGQRTREFKVTVFEYPRLERSDADLAYPDYTGQQPEHIDNTRRVSAVEGSHLGLTLHLNKPVAAAQLVPKTAGLDPIPLTVESNRPIAALNQFPLLTSRTYELQLIDADGRTNKVPAQFVIAVLTNRAPELKLARPRGDSQPSALEEIAFEGTVWDDFGVRNYGLAYTLVGQETKSVELGHDVPAKEKRPFQHVLRLEDLGVQPDQLISWYAWAEDVGPDGRVRRTPGDLYFAEVRPFEEVFREGQDGGQEASGGQGQGQGEAGRLADLQKQIISATWNLQRRQSGVVKPAPATDKPAPDAGPSSKKTSKPVSQAPVHPPLAAQFMGQRAPGTGTARPAISPGSTRPAASSPTDSAAGLSPYTTDAGVVRDSQAQAIEQARTAMARDTRSAALWDAAIQRMEHALERLKTATDSPAALAQALTEEQAAYQALLKLQEHEFQVVRSRSGRQRGGGSRDQQTQRQLDQMDLTEPENRYETQRQAQAPQDAGRREELQVMNRLQELARRQQDLNDRLKELQAALQEARTEPEREDIRRRLKRLQEEEQQMLSDVDELRQRMDQPENQSRMAEERRQLDQTREDIQRAAEASAQGSASQALASGTRAQRQLQEMRDQMRRENSSRFADDLREMRAEARELARQQEDVVKRLEQQANPDHKTLTDAGERQDTLNQLARQRERMTNLVERATQISQDAESSEPLLARQLYDTLRQFSQATGKDLKDIQDKLLNSGLLSQNLADQLQKPAEQDGAKLLDISSEMLRLDFLPPAMDSAERARAGIDGLKRGVERAAESVLGDDTESLRLAQQQLDQLTDQLAREITQARGGGTNSSAGAGRSGGQQSAQQNDAARRGSGGQSETNRENAGLESASAQSGQPDSGQQARAGNRGSQQPGRQSGAQANQAGSNAQAGENPEMASGQDGGPQSGEGNQAGQTPGGQGGQGGGNQSGAQNDQARNGQGQSGQGGNRSGNRGSGGGNRGGNRLANDQNNGGYGGDASGALDRVLDRSGAEWTGPITGEDFVPWSDGLRQVEEMIEIPELRNDVATARERARALRQEYRRDGKKPDWAVVQLQIEKPLVEVRDRIADELARRGSEKALVPLDRDPVPGRYSELVRRYYEELGKDKK